MPAAKEPPPPACTVASGISLKECEDSDGNVLIGSGASKCTGNVVIDKKSLKVGKITINDGGSLILDEVTAAKETPTLETTGIDITSGGSMLIGKSDCPIGTTDPKSKLQIMFVGPKPANCGTPNNQEASECPGWQKGIQVESGGTLRMYGLKGVVPKGGISWTTLSKPAGPRKMFDNKGKNDVGNLFAPITDPNNVIHLAADVSSGPAAWQPNDLIVVATTSFSPWESEFVRIEKVEKEGTGSRIMLKEHLRAYHFGGADPGVPSDANYQADSTTNFGVDERAEVGLVSRNILLTSDSEVNYLDNKKESKHWGGEIRIISGFTAVAIQGVNLRKFGKEQLGAYPIHFHMDGSLAGKADADKLVDSNSVDHSYNKCVGIHSTQDLTISNNVCARITSHMFYLELGDETNIAFNSNLGVGAMSNSFDVHETAEKSRKALIDDFYWPGDHLAKTVPFDQINIFDTGNQFVDEIKNGTPRVRGSCGSFGPEGRILLDRPFTDNHTSCDEAKGDVYFQPPTGFWITNPSAKLIGNSIAGCQDVGKAYWYVPPKDSSNTAAKFIPIGPGYSSFGAETYGVFTNNRGHSCYSGLYGEDDGIVTSDQLFGYQNGIHDKDHQPVVDEFDQLTLSRIRDRGVWLRPTFFVVKDARVATSRDGVSLVTSGGVDGNYPGVWGLLQGSTVIGISQNNEDRWGPCGAKILAPGFGQVRGAEWGCIDQTRPKTGTSMIGGEFTDRGYPSPDWPMYGFLIYDGPPLIIKDRFVNFRVAPGSKAPTGFTAANLLTVADDCILNGCPKQAGWIFNGIPGCPTPPAYSKYEGDAALGWFNVNPSSYPAATTTSQLTFTNVDLRHQIYTEQVNRGGFTDGDENTTIIDHDGTLSGVTALDSDSNELPTISLNNLGINASANSADECLSKGAEDDALEGRPTSGMVPSALGQLEFEQLSPRSPLPFDGPMPNPLNFLAHRELLTFAKNTTDFDTLSNVVHHQTMPLTSRNGLGDWEPKVTNGYGYTVQAGTYQLPSLQCGNVPPTEPPGISGIVDLTLTDIVNAPVIDNDKHPFYVQLGICYTKSDGTHPKFADIAGDLFSISKGYRSYGGGNVVANDTLAPYWGGTLECDGLDNQLAVKNGDPPQDTMTMPAQCPSKSSTGSPITSLSRVDQYSQLTSNGQKNGPPVLDKYFYDENNGWLFLWVAQTEPNAKGPSPLGNCTGDKMTDPAFCPSQTTGDSYYVCPAQGCPAYRIVLNGTYTPGVSNCGDPYSDAQGYSWPAPPPNENTLVLKGTTTPVVRQEQTGRGVGTLFPFPHYATTSAVACPVTTP